MAPQWPRRMPERSCGGAQTQLSADATLTAALEAQPGTTDLSSVSYAYVDASGNLVVFTK